MTGGPAQAWGWVKAKWVNEPYGGGSSSGPSSSTGQAHLAPTPGGWVYPNPYING
jgi:hypothetical protein